MFKWMFRSMLSKLVLLVLFWAFLDVIVFADDGYRWALLKEGAGEYFPNLFKSVFSWVFNLIKDSITS